MPKKIDHLPNAIEFFGYIYFFPNVLVGPSVPIRDYLDLCEGKIYRDTDSSTVIPSLKKFCFSLIFLLFVPLTSNFPYSSILEPSFNNYSFFYKLNFFYFFFYFILFFYYLYLFFYYLYFFYFYFLKIRLFYLKVAVVGHRYFLRLNNLNKKKKIKKIN